MYKLRNKLILCRLVWEILKEIQMHPRKDLKIQVTALGSLHEVAEVYLIRFLEDSNLCVTHLKRFTLIPRDSHCVESIYGDMREYYVFVLFDSLSGLSNGNNVHVKILMSHVPAVHIPILLYWLVSCLSDSYSALLAQNIVVHVHIMLYLSVSWSIWPVWPLFCFTGAIQHIWL